MKLKLEAVRDISVLVAEGQITPETFAVLRAGIKKLFKDGKNKIILELPESGTLATPILRELASLNLLASELAGSIVLAKIAPLTRAKLESFSKPPVVRSFADREAATAFFYPKVEEAEKPKPAAAAPVAPAAAAPVAAPTTAAAAPVTPPASPAPVNEEKEKQFKAEIRSKEMGDLGSVRKKLSEIELENAELKKQLAEIFVKRREPPDLESWKEKVAGLEKQLADTIKAAQDAAGAKK